MSRNPESIRLICFDLNKTLINENTWRNLNLVLGVTAAEDDRLMEQYHEGSISYVQGQAILEQIYKDRGKASRANIQRSISNYTYLASAREVVNELRLRGYEIALISGSIDLLVEIVARDLGIELRGANNTFVFDDKDMLSSIIVKGSDEVAKQELLAGFCTQLGISLDQCVCVGDGDNDRLMFEATGRGVTFRGSKLENSAWKTITELSDLLSLLPKK